MRLLLLLLPLCSLVSNSWAQDTIRHGDRIIYSNEKKYLRSKAFYATVKYAREDIIHSPIKKRVDYCFYMDNERNCWGTNYETPNDSTLWIYDNWDTIVWTYRNASHGFQLERQVGSTTISAQADSLIPFQPTIEIACGIHADTLWVEDYKMVEFSNRFSKPQFSYPQVTIEGEILKEDQLSTTPTLLNGDSIPVLSLKRTDYCLCEPYIWIQSLKCIVTEKGEIKNIQQHRGNVDVENCPGYFQKLQMELDSWGKLQPGTVDGKPVHSELLIEVDMME